MYACQLASVTRMGSSRALHGSKVQNHRRKAALLQQNVPQDMHV